jgi:hypothetical protein
MLDNGLLKNIRIISMFKKDITNNREKAIELVNAWFDGKDIVMKDPIHGVEDWISVRHPDFWSYLGEFCVNVDKYKII